MDRKHIDDNHIVARYLADQLTDPERAQFETYYLEHPEVVREMEATAHFKAGLMRLRDTGELGRLSQQRLPWYRRKHHLALAATLAILAIGVVYIADRRPAAQPLLVARQDALTTWGGRAFAVGSTHTIVRTRSASYDARIKLRHAAEAIELRVLPEFAAPHYQISLTRVIANGATESLAQVGSLEPDADGMVEVYVNGARIGAGRYELMITADPPDGGAGRRSTFLLEAETEI
jgi:hypothetical protein